MSPHLRSADDPAVLTARLLLRIGFGVLVVLVPTTAAFSRWAVFVLLPFAASLIFIAGALDHPHEGRRQFINALRSPMGLAVLFVILWSALSLLWTPFPSDAQVRLFKVAGTIFLAAIAVAFLPERMRLSTLYLLPIGAGIAAVMTLAIGLNGGSGLTGSTELDSFTLRRAAVTLVILVWPALSTLAVRGRRLGAAALALAVLGAALAARVPVALLALGLGGLAYGASVLDARRTTRILAVAGAVLFLTAPLLPLVIEAALKATVGGVPEWMQPIAIWADIVRANKERLVTGHGLEAAVREVAGGYLPPGTPKSFLFEVWFELGVIGAVAVAIVVARAFRGAARVGEGVAPFLVAALASALTLSVLDQNAAQLWWVTLLGVGVIACAGAVHGQYHTRRPRLAATEPRQF